MCFQQIVKIAVINQSVCCYISATQTISTKGKYLDNSDKEIPWISPSWSTLRTLTRVKQEKIESDNRRNFNELRRLFVCTAARCGAHTDIVSL